MTDRRLDFLGENLLAARVDRDRVAPEHLDGAVRTPTRLVAGHRVADAVDRRERSRRLVGIVEIAERHGAERGPPPDLIRRAVDHSTQVLADDDAVASRHETASRRVAALRRNLGRLA